MATDERVAALHDLRHAIINSNEFLLRREVCGCDGIASFAQARYFGKLSRSDSVDPAFVKRHGRELIRLF